jgi:hypothetical protein
MQRLGPYWLSEEVVDMELVDDRFTFPRCELMLSRCSPGRYIYQGDDQLHTLNRWVPEVLKMAGMRDWVRSATLDYLGRQDRSAATLRPHTDVIRLTTARTWQSSASSARRLT